MGTRFAVEHPAKIDGVLIRGAPDELLGGGSGDPVVERIDHEFRDDPVAQLQDCGGGGGGYFVEMVMTVHHPGVGCSGRLQDLGHPPRHARIRHAHHLAFHVAGIGQGAQHVEHRGHPQFTAHRGGVAHGRMEPWGQTEADAGSVDACSHPLGRDVQGDTEGLQNIGRAAEGTRCPAAVFAYQPARPRHHERSCGGNVDRVTPVTSGAAGADSLLPD